MKWIVQIPENHFGTGLHTFDRKWLAVSFASRWMDVSGKFPPKPKIYKGKCLKGTEIRWEA